MKIYGKLLLLYVFHHDICGTNSFVVQQQSPRVVQSRSDPALGALLATSNYLGSLGDSSSQDGSKGVSKDTSLDEASESFRMATMSGPLKGEGSDKVTAAAQVKDSATAPTPAPAPSTSVTDPQTVGRALMTMSAHRQRIWIFPVVLNPIFQF
jgi:hypothetical protein